MHPVPPGLLLTVDLPFSGTLLLIKDIDAYFQLRLVAARM